MAKPRVKVRDDAGLAVLTAEEVGASRALTPEGFLLCKDVPLARTGWMIYGPNETPIEAGTDGIARVYRGPEDLFTDNTFASLIAKPVVDDHPEDDVTPKTWRDLARGIVLNPRQGEGEFQDCIVGDLLVTDQEGIDAINANKVEVSCGYDADYEQTGPGTGRQSNLIFNHVALVERGRCGPRCAIGDQATATEKEPNMGQRVTVKTGNRQRAAILPHVRKAFKDAENAALEAMGIDPSNPEAEGGPETMEGGGSGGDTHIHIHTAGETAAAVPSEDEVDPAPGTGDPGQPGSIEDRVAALEAGLQQILALLQGDAGEGGEADPAAGETTEDPEAAGDEADPDVVDQPGEEGEADPTKGKTGDSAALANSYQATLALAEVLVPGFKMPTFDAAAKRATTVDNLCAARRKALDTVYATADGQQLVNTVAGKTGDAALDLGKMKCGEVATLFKAAAGAKSLLNNRAQTGDGKMPHQYREPEAANPNAAPRTVDELNEFYAKYYASAAK